MNFQSHAITDHETLDQRSGFRNDPVLLSKMQSTDGSSQRPVWPNLMTPNVFDNIRTTQFLSSLEEPESGVQLPAFVRPLPTKIAAEDVKYLHVKGALTLPTLPLQNALLQAYVEYVHPYMPLMDLNSFLSIINNRDGSNGQISLFLYQAVMFAASAFVEMKYLREGGYTTRKSARKSFFQKTRVGHILSHSISTDIHMSIVTLRFRLRVRSSYPRTGSTFDDVLV